MYALHMPFDSVLRRRRCYLCVSQANATNIQLEIDSINREKLHREEMWLLYMVYGFNISDASMAICDVRNNVAVSYRRRNQLIYIESFQSCSSTFRNIQREYGFVAVLFSQIYRRF